MLASPAEDTEAALALMHAASNPPQNEKEGEDA